jgi:hypothetical protein
MSFKGKLITPAIETAVQLALTNAIVQYNIYHERLLKNQSTRAAKMARYWLQKIRTLTVKRRMEIIMHYSKHRNKKIS